MGRESEWLKARDFQNVAVYYQISSVSSEFSLLKTERNSMFL